MSSAPHTIHCLRAMNLAERTAGCPSQPDMAGRQAAGQRQQHTKQAGRSVGRSAAALGTPRCAPWSPAEKAAAMLLWGSYSVTLLYKLLALLCCAGLGALLGAATNLAGL